MEIWLGTGGSQVRLPFVDADNNLGLKKRVNDKTANLYEIGDILVIGNQGLAEFSYSSFFPSQGYGFLDINNPPDPWSYVEFIEGWMKEDEPVRLILTDTPINIEMRIQDFDYKLEDSTGDVYYSLNMTEYKRLEEKTKAKAGKYSKAERRPRSKNSEEPIGMADRENKNFHLLTKSEKKGDTFSHMVYREEK